MDEKELDKKTVKIIKHLSDLEKKAVKIKYGDDLPEDPEEQESLIEFEYIRRRIKEIETKALLKLKKKPEVDFRKIERCSFCIRSKEKAGKLVAGPFGVSICKECAKLCIDLIDKNR